MAYHIALFNKKTLCFNKKEWGRLLKWFINPYKVLGKCPPSSLRAFRDLSPSASSAIFLWSCLFSRLQTTVENYIPQGALPASDGSQPMGGNIRVGWEEEIIKSCWVLTCSLPGSNPVPPCYTPPGCSPVPEAGMFSSSTLSALGKLMLCLHLLVPECFYFLFSLCNSAQIPVSSPFLQVNHTPGWFPGPAALYSHHGILWQPPPLRLLSPWEPCYRPVERFLVPDVRAP